MLADCPQSVLVARGGCPNWNRFVIYANIMLFRLISKLPLNEGN